MSDKLTPQQRHNKAAIKQEQSDAYISSAERGQARRSANMAAIHSKDTKPEMIVRRVEEIQNMHLCEWLLLAWTRSFIEH